MTHIIDVMIIAFISYPPLSVKQIEHQDPDHNTETETYDSDQDIYDTISHLVVHIILLLSVLFHRYDIVFDEALNA